MVAMAGMFLTGDPTFEGFGVATIIVVAVAVLGSLTVLPAMLSWLGDRVESPRSRSSTRSPKHGEGRFWSAIRRSCATRSRRSILAGGLSCSRSAPSRCS